jgi:hypothetical protein
MRTDQDKGMDDEWEIFPFDQKEDGRRWARLIEEMDHLSQRFDTAGRLLSGFPADADLASERDDSTKENTGF